MRALHLYCLRNDIKGIADFLRYPIVRVVLQEIKSTLTYRSFESRNTVHLNIDDFVNTSSFVIAMYVRMCIILQDSSALPLELFTKPLNIDADLEPAFVKGRIF